MSYVMIGVIQGLFWDMKCGKDALQNNLKELTTVQKTSPVKIGRSVFISR